MTNVKTKTVKTKPIKKDNRSNFTVSVLSALIMEGNQEEINKMILEGKVIRLLSNPAIKNLLKFLRAAPNLDVELEAFYKSLLI